MHGYCELLVRSLQCFRVPIFRSGGNLQPAPDLIHEVMIDTAASEPLIERNYRPAFDPVSFFRKALERVEAEGRG